MSKNSYWNWPGHILTPWTPNAMSPWPGGLPQILESEGSPCKFRMWSEQSPGRAWQPRDDQPTGGSAARLSPPPSGRPPCGLSWLRSHHVSHLSPLSYDSPLGEESPGLTFIFLVSRKGKGLFDFFVLNPVSDFFLFKSHQHRIFHFARYSIPLCCSNSQCSLLTHVASRADTDISSSVRS